MDANAQLVVVIRCPLCGAWAINTRFQEHQASTHSQIWVNGPVTPSDGSAMLETPPPGPAPPASGSHAGDPGAGLARDAVIAPVDATAMVAELRMLFRLGLDAALAFHMWKN